MCPSTSTESESVTTSPTAAHADFVGVRPTFVKAIVLFALAVCLTLAGLYAYRLAQTYDFLRSSCLIALIVTGIALTACFAGIFHYLDALVSARPRRWYIRWPFFHLKQLMLLLELAALAVALYVAMVLLFGFKFP